MDTMQNKCNCTHHKTIPVLVILFGLAFLLQALDVISSGFVMIAWPIIIIAVGVMKLVEKSGVCKCC
ncbi:MAG: hypothetical protein A3D34_03300 [Candidatus Staskawiczbacteria bacterium RIFCSPHIGHO2_02_FULL_33_16]|uniref:LiaI-LiaF-like transmembrane region domain-containing protein n=1 Tax=Candidatus Staskawiczbacteria bacterium RIFCSPHIGHO2_02_FULL_33_16 TaxID=1802204 RepID=A0A1G2HTR3_9BACT|nr:MAG: hypothetical protein A3D34_03300 [Candidatus Staskawiczbacteria bacterium RIFCSPHIGHO2_02_FULL_33_16]OGZ70501.1 MAG: hypothetical protein A2980_00945 [Candidatus Staskawiczbacteria bacterium RIFCSPLOWO2_01_FULL_33_13]